jgi:hypothetical protein
MAQKTALSRRSFLAASGATLAASTAVVVPAALAHAAEPDPDAELLALVEQWHEAWEHHRQLAEALDRAETRYYAMRPKFPEACNRQPGDPALNLCSSADVGKPYEAPDIEELRAHGRKRALVEILTPKERARLGIISDPYGGKRRDPGPEAQARAKELVSAWDKYHADMERADEESGIDAAQEAQDEALNAVDEIRDEIARTRANSPKGMLIKARLASIDRVNQSGLEHDLESVMSSRPSTPEALGLSLILDLLRMNGGQA